MPTNQEISRNFQVLVESDPALKRILPALEQNHIHYGLFAGAFLALYANGTAPDDLDFLIADDDFTKLTKLYPDAQIIDHGNYTSLILGDHDEIEFVYRNNVRGGGKEYPLRLTPEAIANLRPVEAGGLTISTCDPVESLILYAIMQRGQDLGKNDLLGIELLKANTTIDPEYLRLRIQQTGSAERVMPILTEMGAL